MTALYLRSNKELCTLPNCSLNNVVDFAGADITNNVPITGSISKTGEVTIKLVKSGSQGIIINTFFISQ